MCVPTSKASKPKETSFQISYFADVNPPKINHNEMLTPDKAKKKCRTFLTTLLRISSKQQSTEVQANVQALIQDLVDGRIEPEPFTAQLQLAMNSSPQLSLVPFIEQSLPHLRQVLFLSNYVAGQWKVFCRRGSSRPLTTLL